PPDDVLEDLVVPPVVGGVDDPLVAPARPRMRARRAEEEAERLDERAELGAPLGERRRDVRERRLLARLHLDLRGDQLADEVRLERRSPCRGLHLLDAVDEVERLPVEQCELLLHRDREVLGRLEALACLGEKLLVGNAVGGVHLPRRLDAPASLSIATPPGVSDISRTHSPRGAGRRRLPSSSAPRPPRGPLPGGGRARPGRRRPAPRAVGGEPPRRGWGTRPGPRAPAEAPARARPRPRRAPSAGRRPAGSPRRPLPPRPCRTPPGTRRARRTRPPARAGAAGGGARAAP